VSEICDKFESTYPELKNLDKFGKPLDGTTMPEKKEDEEVTPEIFDLLSQLQEYG